MPTMLHITEEVTLKLHEIVLGREIASALGSSLDVETVLPGRSKGPAPGGGIPIVTGLTGTVKVSSFTPIKSGPRPSTAD